MNSRERTIAAIEFGTPDKIPIWHEYLTNFAYEHPDFLKTIFTKYPGDMNVNEEADVLPPILSADDLKTRHGRVARDEWGCVWQYEVPGMQGIVIENPIRSYDQMKTFSIPNINRVNWSALRAKMSKRSHQRYVWTYPPNFFHLLTFLLGYEKFVVDLTTAEEGLFELMNLILEKHHLPYIRNLVALDCDGLFFGDDMGTQTQLMVSPLVWRNCVKEFYRRQFEIVKEAGKHVILHSDGYILDIIPDLMEIGMDALNPQHEIMEPEKLLPLVKGKLCILTDLDRQWILPRGTPDDVANHIRAVRQKFWTAQGGIIFHGELAVDVPLANIEVMYAAFEAFR